MMKICPQNQRPQTTCNPELAGFLSPNSVPRVKPKAGKTETTLGTGLVTSNEPVPLWCTVSEWIALGSGFGVDTGRRLRTGQCRESAVNTLIASWVLA